MEKFESREMYLETIYELREKMGNVRAVDIAAALGYAKSSVSVAIKNLKEAGMLDVESSGQIILSKEGESLAKYIAEKHGLLTKFFISIGVEEQIASADACKIEHVISDETIAVIQKYLSK
ncbi:MAG: metal-dependent transcriptional regulator [Bacillota bacterium]